MITFLFFCFLIWIVVSAFKKDKHNKAEDAAQIERLPEFTIRATKMGSFDKFLNLAYDPNYLLKEFSYKNGLLSVTNEAGDNITARLDELFVEFGENSGLTLYDVWLQKRHVSFYYTTNITKNEWDVINNVLCLAGSTRGKDMFQKSYTRLKYLNTAIKAIDALT